MYGYCTCWYMFGYCIPIVPCDGVEWIWVDQLNVARTEWQMKRLFFQYSHLYDVTDVVVHACIVFSMLFADHILEKTLVQRYCNQQFWKKNINNIWIRLFVCFTFALLFHADAAISIEIWAPYVAFIKRWTFSFVVLSREKQYTKYAFLPSALLWVPVKSRGRSKKKEHCDAFALLHERKWLD